MKQISIQAIQRAITPRAVWTTLRLFFRKGNRVQVRYASSKENEADQWISAVVKKTVPHYLEVRRLKADVGAQETSVRPAYEDVRPVPKSELANELMQSSDVDMINANIGDALPMTTQILTLKRMTDNGLTAGSTLGNSLEERPTAHEL